jgi:hypothetical protein
MFKYIMFCLIYIIFLHFISFLYNNHFINISLFNLYKNIYYQFNLYKHIYYQYGLSHFYKGFSWAAGIAMLLHSGTFCAIEALNAKEVMDSVY